MKPRTVRIWEGGGGIGGRDEEYLFTDSPSVMAKVQAQGCGAWVGRTACGNAADAYLTCSAPWLFFLSYRSINQRLPDGTLSAIVFACERHIGDVGEMTQDMPRDLFLSQSAELRTYIDSHAKRG